MKKWLKGVLIAVGTTLGVIVVGVSVAYAALGVPPKLERKVNALEELLPRNVESYALAADLIQIERLYRRSQIGRTARRLGIEEDFSNLKEVATLMERTRGKFLDLLGPRFLIADYGERGKLLVTEPRWIVKTFWRAVLTKGTQKQFDEIPYAIMSDSSAVAFAGDYFWFASSEELLKDALRIASSETLREESDFPRAKEKPLAYGISRRPGKYLDFDELRWQVFEGDYGIEAMVEVDKPDGVLGGLLANISEPQDYSAIPQDAPLFINLAGADPYKAWKEAEKIALDEGTDEVLADIGKEKQFTIIATDLKDEALLVFQGWNVDLWYGPARWLTYVKASSQRTTDNWEKLVGWLFPQALDTSLSYSNVDYHYLDFGVDLPPLAYLYLENDVMFSSDTALLYHTLDSRAAGSTMANSKEFSKVCNSVGILKPSAYLSWPRFKDVLKPYLLYAADRTAGFTPADVEAKLFPLLDAVDIKALVLAASGNGKTLSLTLRAAR